MLKTSKWSLSRWIRLGQEKVSDAVGVAPALTYSHWGSRSSSGQAAVPKDSGGSNVRKLTVCAGPVKCQVGHQNPPGKVWLSTLILATQIWEVKKKKKGHRNHFSICSTKLSSSSMPGMGPFSGTALERKSPGGPCSYGTFRFVWETERNESTRTIKA